MATPPSSVSRFILPSLLASAMLCQAQTSLTVYNQGFAVVRERLPLDLQAGVNEVRFAGATARVEPDSVILRDPAGAVDLRILEQNYRADPVSEGLLLSLNEGKTIEFLVPGSGATTSQVVEGRIVRSGYQPGSAGDAGGGYNGYNGLRNQNPLALIEVEGKLQFGLPGIPRFPSLPDDTLLKPTLVWKLHSEKPAKLDAEVGYLTNGLGWDAAYNIVAPEKGDALDLTGWVTIQNQSGKTFTDAGIQLMAGDVSKLQEQARQRGYSSGSTPFVGTSNYLSGLATEKPFEDYHLYTLPLPSTLRDGGTKQVEFAKATGVASSKIFVYDGVKIDRNRWANGGMESYRSQVDYGTDANTKVAVMREFKNSRENHLGIPLPKGAMRFYRRDDDGRLQFVGENLIDHTASDETVRINTGNAFDLVGDRKRTSYKQDESRARWFDETFEITLRNHQKSDVEIRVVEHLYRWTNWEITESSNTYLKTDAQTIEFRIPLKPDEERKVTYTVHYSW